MAGDTVDDTVAAAQHIVDVASAEAKAETVAAFYGRLRLLKVPVAAAREFTVLEFYSHDTIWEDEE